MIHAVLRFGKFTSIETLPEIVSELAIVAPDGISAVSLYEADKYSDHHMMVLYFRLNRELSDDIYEYIFVRREDK